MWLNEGFATFMPGAYWREKQGAHAAEDYYLGKYRDAREADKERRMPLAADGSNNVYPKGAMVLEMLRKYLGDERFWAGINRYLTTHAFGVAVSDDLRQAFLDATGENLSWFWDQWIYQAGLPQFNVSASWDSASAVLTLVATQTQSDTGTADSTGLRYSVPPVFRMPVTVRVETASGALLHREWIENRVDTVSIVDVRTAPRMVVFDDGNTVYKELTFSQPVEWLATQLERDADLWNRSWVIDQLRARASDSVAVGALTRCATRADYFLTRLKCTDALSEAAGPGVVQALTGAVRDTSAQVREAAVVALGGQKDETVKEVIRSVFEHDTSYNVRAAALHRLAGLDPVAAPGLIRTGLVTPSYQNVIQDAALSAAAQSADTSLLGDVDARMGDQDNPAYLLAGFATRGSTRALALLIARLNDPRPRVRSRALDALGYVRPEIALEPLKAAEPDVRDEETRSGVGEMIERLSRPAPPKQ
jgi:aminopeptidase N